MLDCLHFGEESIFQIYFNFVFFDFELKTLREAIDIAGVFDLRGFKEVIDLRKILYVIVDGVKSSGLLPFLRRLVVMHIYHPLHVSLVICELLHELFPFGRLAQLHLLLVAYGVWQFVERSSYH